MAAQIIAIINQKGGVCKTTTSLALAEGLVAMNKKVLTIDLDAQANRTLAANILQPDNTISQVLEGQQTIKDITVDTPGQGAIAPANITLATTEATITGRANNAEILKTAIGPIKNNYDYIIIDTAPHLDILTTNALTAAEYIVIPTDTDIFSLSGISQLNILLEAVKEKSNPDLKIAGLLITKYERGIINEEMKSQLEQMAQAMNTKVFKTPIRKAIAIKQAITEGKNIFTACPKSNSTIDYKNWIKELLRGIKK